MRHTFLKFIATSLLMIPFLGTIAENEKKQNKCIIPPTIKTETTVDFISNPKSYLSSFSNSEIKNKNGLIHYSSEDEYSKYYKTEQLAEKPNEDKLFFEANCIPEIGIIFFDVGIKNEEGIIEEQERLYCYPFLNENEEYDVKIDIHSFVVYASEVIKIGPVEKDHYPDPHFSYMIIDGGGGGGSSLYPIASIVLALANYTQCMTFASQFIVVPSMLESGPAPYVFYKFKLDTALNHYQYNCNYSNPTTYIFNQHDENYSFDEWKFGVAGNVYSNGCGPIAVFNLLYDSGANPNLALILAVFELCNADLLGGVFGANMIPQELLNNVTTVFVTSFNLIFVPTFQLLIPEIATSILNNIIATSPWWAQIYLGLTYVTEWTTIAIALETILLVSTIIVNSFIPWYVASIHSTGDIITIFTGNYSVVSSYNYSDYSSNLSTRRQSIVCYWNDLTDSGSIDYLEGAHYIYTRKEQSYFVSYNNPYSGNGNNNNQFDYLYETFGVSNGTDASTKMMVAYVLQS